MSEIEDHFERVRQNAEFKARSYVFELVEFEAGRGERGEMVMLTWRAEKPHPVRADMMIRADEMEMAEGSKLAAEVRDRVLYDMNNQALMSNIRADGRKKA